MDINYKVALAPSRLAGAFILVAGMATLALVAGLPVDSLPRLAAIAWIGSGMLEAYRSIALRVGARGVREVAIRGDVIEALNAQGRPRDGRIVDGSFVAPWLTVIRWRPHGAAFDRSVVILPDMLERDAFRRLRVALKWRKGNGG